MDWISRYGQPTAWALFATSTLVMLFAPRLLILAVPLQLLAAGLFVAVIAGRRRR
jgi:uncharacterized membrane protein YvlD (DUF360 family)